MKPTKLADATARMLGWQPSKLKLKSTYWEAVNCKVYYTDKWSPHTDYNHCRIVEDWIWEKGLWGLYLLKQIGIGTAINVTASRLDCEQRCRAALAAWKASKRRAA